MSPSSKWFTGLALTALAGGWVGTAQGATTAPYLYRSTTSYASTTVPGRAWGAPFYSGGQVGADNKGPNHNYVRAGRGGL